MQISPSLHSYEKTPRSQVYDRRVTATEQSDEPSINRRDDAITGSRAVLSNSLAEALWAIQRGSEDDTATSSAVESLYLSYSE
jgi:hypothetical protein